MTESTPSPGPIRERAFLDANVLRGNLTTDLLLSLAEHDVFRPAWSWQVLDEARRNRPAALTEELVDRRIATMNRAFPEALTADYQGLEPSMRADAKDRHVLAAAVTSRARVLVTENIRDFDPPSHGPHAIAVERLAVFLTRKLTEAPGRVVPALQGMVDRYRRAPRTMPELIDHLVTRPDLAAFARQLNTLVPPEQRGTSAALSPDLTTSRSAALDGLPAPHPTSNQHRTPPRRSAQSPDSDRHRE